MNWSIPRGYVAVVVVVAALAGGGVLAFWLKGTDHHGRDVGWGLLVVGAFLALVFILTEYVGTENPNTERAKYGYLEVALGSDGYVSTSKAVTWLWTLVFASSLMLLSGMVWFGKASPEDAFGGDWSAYFLLLGGPFASAVLAKGITVSKAGSQTAVGSAAASVNAVNIVRAKKGSANSVPRASDLGTHASGDTSLTDTQYMIFTLVAIAYFVGDLTVNLVRYGHGGTAVHLPTIPQALLGLTSLSALTYVGAKAVATNGLRIMTVSPEHAPPGSTVKVTLVNAPTTLTAEAVTVLVTGPDGSPSDSRGAALEPPVKRAGKTAAFSFQVPALPARSDYQLVVMTPDGTTSPTAFGIDQIPVRLVGPRKPQAAKPALPKTPNS